MLLAPSAASAAWTVPPTPNMDGADTSNLLAVDCSSATSCVAVGLSTTGSGTGSATLAERWNGASWRIMPTPNPPGATFSSLNGVSCPRPNVCFAVGSSDSGPLVELWNGASWSIRSSPAIANGKLNAVSCSRLLACTAVGSGGTVTLAERWDGTGWHVQPTPNAAGSQFSSLAGVSCPLKRTCTAVGESVAGSITSPLVERWFGRVNAWGLQTAPKPEGAESASLADVSCPDGPVCVATGSSMTQLGPTTTLAERRIGSNWSVLPTPNPPQGTGVNQSDISGVSCPARRACHAVGASTVSQSDPIPIAERFDGASWRLEPVPSATLPFPFLAGVSCPNRRFCMAVGGYNLRFSGGTLSAKWVP